MLTNFAARSLDEKLHTRQGPIRTFLILARYCSRTVFEEQLELLRQRSSSLLWPSNLVQLLRAWASYVRVGVKLSLYEWYLSLQGSLRMEPATL